MTKKLAVDCMSNKNSQLREEMASNIPCLRMLLYKVSTRGFKVHHALGLKPEHLD